jgi:hypothetical protein
MHRWLALVVALVPALARAADDPTQCRLLDISMVAAPSGDNQSRPQIVAWIEDPAGNFVDTAYITHATGLFGIGNRPGRFDFNSGPNWPYGRRVTTFPVWSTKQPLRWPEVVFKDGADSNLSHKSTESSEELHFCRPVLPKEFDATSCPSSRVLTDKGVMSSKMVNYPPRNDLDVRVGDDPSVEMFSTMNPFDAVSAPTPALGEDARVTYAFDPALPFGDYVLFIEVSKEFDFNASYNEDVFPSPDVSFGSYGLPYRGQPSVVYRIPFTLSQTETTALTTDYIGYGDPDGVDGNIRPPDATISTTPGSGAARLALTSANGETYRARLRSYREIDEIAPAAPMQANVIDATSSSVTLELLAPGDDGTVGFVKSYEVRYLVGGTITEENFDSAQLVVSESDIVGPGEIQTVKISGLVPETEYSLGIRALDNCRNRSPLVVVPATTTERAIGEVPWCFIATAAYGSVMANDVETLRRFRDGVLGKTALGELAIEAYYTFSPSLAGLIGESEILRHTARTALQPIVDRVKR